MSRPLDHSRTIIPRLSTDEALRWRLMLVDGQIKANFRFGYFMEVLDMLAGDDAALSYARAFRLNRHQCELDRLPQIREGRRRKRELLTAFASY